MKRIKMALTAMVAVLAVSAVGATAASASSDGHGVVTAVGGTCDVLFDRSAWVPTSAGDPLHVGTKSNISNVRVDPGGSCGVDSISGSGVMYTNAAGDAYFDGTFEFRALFNLIRCGYTGSAEGTWSAGNGPGSHSSDAGKNFSVSGSADRDYGSNPPCTDPADFSIAGWVKD